jgi:hypothetical protein
MVQVPSSVLANLEVILLAERCSDSFELSTVPTNSHLYIFKYTVHPVFGFLHSYGANNTLSLLKCNKIIALPFWILLTDTAC